MSFNINDFKSTLNKFGGPARKNLFAVEISQGPAGNANFNRDLRFFCQTASIPGLNLSVADYYPNGFGVKQSIPIAMGNDQFNAVFMLDSEHRVLSFFHEWIQQVINYNYSNGPFSQVRDQLPFEVGYKKDFACDISIKHFSTSTAGDSYYEYTLHDAFPTQVSGIDASWADNDSFATATVNFAYAHLSVDSANTGNPNERFSRGTGLLQYINTLGTSGQTISQNSLPNTIQDAVNAFSRT